jgi:phosphatidylglycerol:prolipoprotein diacylglycerol transferase
VLPYVEVPPLALGPVPLQPFGAMVALALVVGYVSMMRRARALGIDEGEFRALWLTALAFGFFFAHALDVAFYRPEELAHRPLSLLFVWDGLSSMGGFVGALVGGIFWKYVTWRSRGAVLLPVRRARPAKLLPMADVVIAMFPLAWIFGRAGCALVHDHVSARVPDGTLLAVAFPGGARYDLGLLELLFTIVLAALLAMTWRRRVPVGTYVAVVSLAYAPVRFAMDFMRDTPIEGGEGADLRWGAGAGALTFAQWTCVLLFVFGLAMIAYVRKMRSTMAVVSSGVVFTLVACGGATPASTNPSSREGAPKAAASATASESSGAVPTGAATTPASVPEAPVSSSIDATHALDLQIAKGKRKFPKQTVGFHDCWKSIGLSGNAEKDYRTIIAACGEPTGMLEFVAPARGELGPSHKRDTFSVKMDNDYCYRIFAAGDASIGDLDIRVEKNGGALVLVDKTTQPVAIIDSDKAWCADQDTTYTVHFDVDGPGHGKYVFGIWAKPK